MLIKAGDIVSKTIELYKKNWQLFIKYTILFLIPPVLVSLLALYLYPNLIRQEKITAVFDAKLIIYLITTAVASLISVWFSIAFFRAIITRYEQKEGLSIKEELMNSVKLIVPVILISLLIGLIVIGGTLLLIIPGIIFSMWYAFSFYAVIVDGKSVINSLEASKVLVKGRWWGVLWRLFLPGMVFGIITYVAVMIIALPFAYMPNVFVVIAIAKVVISFVFTLFASFTSAAISILYVELKKTPVMVEPAEPPQA